MEAGVRFETLASKLIDDNIVDTVIINLRDITERKQAEFQKDAALEALRESEERYRPITENMSDMVSDLDAQGQFTYHQSFPPEDSGLSARKIS